MHVVVDGRNLGTDVSLDTMKSLSRDDLESNLTFISLLLFRNELKPDTCSAIKNLREGEVGSMAISVHLLRILGCSFHRFCVESGRMEQVSILVSF